MLLDYLVLHFVAQILALAHLDHSVVLLRSGMERLDLVALGNFVVHNYVIVHVVVADARALARFAVRGGWTVRGDSLVGLGSSAHTVADGGGGDVQRGQRVYGHVEGGVEDRIVGPDSGDGDRHDHHVVSVAYVHVASHVSVACARVGDDDDDHGEDGDHSVG